MFTKTPPIEPIVPAYRLRLLDDKQLEQFQSGTFEIPLLATAIFIKT